MPFNKKKTIYKLAVLMPLIAATAGCKTMDTAMTDMRERVASIEMPDFSKMSETVTNKASNLEIQNAETVGMNNDDAAPTNNINQARIAANDGVIGNENVYRNEYLETASFARASTPEDEMMMVSQISSIEPAAGMDMGGNQNCPRVETVTELTSLHQFSSPRQPTENRRISSVYLNNIESRCYSEDGNMVVELDMEYEGVLGPKARIFETDKPNFAYPYFVALTNGDSQIINKDVFAVTMTYDQGKDRVIYKETLKKIIPSSHARDAENLSLIIGMQLNDDELAFNRSDIGRQYSTISDLGVIAPAAGAYDAATASSALISNAMAAPKPLEKPQAIENVAASSVAKTPKPKDITKAEAEIKTNAETAAKIEPAAGAATNANRAAGTPPLLKKDPVVKTTAPLDPFVSDMPSYSDDFTKPGTPEKDTRMKKPIMQHGSQPATLSDLIERTNAGASGAPVDLTE